MSKFEVTEQAIIIRSRNQILPWNEPSYLRVSEIPNEARFRELLASIQPSTREDQRFIAIRAGLGR
jgi:hypothetical protein